MKEIQRIFAQGNTEEALQKLHEYIQKKDPNWEQAVLLLKASYAHLQKQELLNTINPEEANRERNRINAHGLSLLEQVTMGKSPKRTFTELKNQFWNPEIENIMSQEGQNNTNISNANINIQSSSEVLIGSGNTVNKKIVNALGKWQFWLIILGIIGLATFGFFGINSLSGGQDTVVTSVQDLEDELQMLAEEKPELKQQLSDLQAQLKTGLQSLRSENYTDAIKNLEQLVQKAPIAGAYQSLAIAYEKEGDIEKAYAMRNQAQKINPEVFATKNATKIKGKYVNLLAPENGGELIIATNPKLEKAINGQLDYNVFEPNSWAVFGFNESRIALIDRFDFYIPKSSGRTPKAIELFVSTESETGPFDTLAVFNPLNALIKKKPFQEFPFKSVQAKYVKVVIVDSYEGFLNAPYIYEIRLWGKLK